MPTLAHRVWPSTTTSAASSASARWSSASSRIAARSTRGVVAELADLGRGLVHERELVAACARTEPGAEQRVGRRAPRPAAPTAGSARSSPWWRTRRCRPAESRPRTSSRSMADSATCTERNASMAASDGSAPASAADLAGGAQAVAPDGPDRVLGAHQCGVDRVPASRGARLAPEPSSSSASSASSRAGELLDAVLDRPARPAGRRAGPARPGTPRSARSTRLDQLGGARRSSVDESASVDSAPPARRARVECPTSAAASGTGRVARRRTTPTMPHMGGKVSRRAGCRRAAAACSTSSTSRSRGLGGGVRRRSPRPSPAPAARCPTGARAPGRRRRARRRRRAPGSRTRRRCASVSAPSTATLRRTCGHAGDAPTPAPTATARAGPWCRGGRCPVSVPSPVVAWSAKITWPDCSPPSARLRCSSTSSTLRSPTGVSITAIAVGLERAAQARGSTSRWRRPRRRGAACGRGGRWRRWRGSGRRRRAAPRSSTAITRSASPSNARPASARGDEHRFLELAGVGRAARRR